MTDTELRIETLVEHPARPEWGPGKVVRVQGTKVEVFFRDRDDHIAGKFEASVLRVASVQEDPLLRDLPELVERKGKLGLARARITVAEAKRRFLQRFPGGFQDPEFIGTPKGGERTYKWLAHERYEELLGNGKGRTLLQEGGVEALRTLLSKTIGRAGNLLAVTEMIAFRQGLADPVAAAAYFGTLFDLVEAGPGEERFNAHAQAVAALPSAGATHADKWTIATLLPFFARPDTFVFVKPGNMKKAAAALAFEIAYDSSPNWHTYERILRLANVYREQLADLGARDFIDVQSFFWITGDTYEAVRAANQAKKQAHDAPH
ncbi:MAG: DUF3553 domain-containing protein [Candidatus Bipolaricaulota bacterium]